MGNVKVVRRNALTWQVHEHPNEYLIYSQSAKDFNVDFFECPHCGRRVKKLFTMAHSGDPGMLEAEGKFTRNSGTEVMCGFDLATLLSDTDAVVLGEAKR